MATCISRLKVWDLQEFVSVSTFKGNLFKIVYFKAVTLLLSLAILAMIFMIDHCIATYSA